MADHSNEDLKIRVERLETYLKVGVIVAGIFGVGAGFGASAISSANSEIQKVRSDAKVIGDELSALNERVAELIQQVGAAETQLTDHATTLRDDLDRAVQDHVNNLSMIASDRVEQEIRERISHRVIGSGHVECDLRDAPAATLWTEVCTRKVSGNFGGNYNVLTSITHSYHRSGEIPPIYSISAVERSSDGFILVVRLGQGRLNEIVVHWLAISSNQN